MSWTNYHSHTHFCDGKLGPEAYAAEAARQGLWAYGFSSHAPLPYAAPWGMRPESVTSYLSQIARLQADYRGRLELYAGLEVDFVPGKLGPQHPFIRHLELDYCIGSVHFVDTFPDGVGWEIDGPHEVFLRGLREIFDGDIRRAVGRYYGLTRQMVEQEPPTVVGHLDKIKIQNEGGRLFSETQPWYRDEVMATLQAIAGAGVLLEVNTRGIYKQKTPELYPSRWVLARACELQIPLTLNSDAHHPREITEQFSYAAGVLAEVGYTHLHSLLDNRWQPFRFTVQGLVARAW
jgi:histidinol-phosphatase (PHP family)